MKHFLKIGACDTLPLLHAVHRQPELWGKDRVRTAHPRSAHYGGEDIILRYNAIDMKAPTDDEYLEKVCAEVMCVDYPAFAALPEARRIVFGLMARLEGEQLGRVFVTRTKPGGATYAHVDGFPPAALAYPNKPMPWMFYERYHVIMKSQDGVVFTTGDEAITPETGEVLWHDKLALHDVVNKSDEDYLHMIVDIRCHR